MGRKTCACDGSCTRTLRSKWFKGKAL